MEGEGFRTNWACANELTNRDRPWFGFSRRMALNHFNSLGWTRPMAPTVRRAGVSAQVKCLSALHERGGGDLFGHWLSFAAHPCPIRSFVAWKRPWSR